MTDRTPQTLHTLCWKTVGINGDGSCERLPREGHCRNCAVFAREGLRLLDRPSPEGFLEDYARLLSGRKETDTGEALSCFLFRIRGEWLALPTVLCRSVGSPKPVHSVPGRSGRVFRGLVNVEGELLPLLSGEAVLGITGDESAEAGPSARFLVVERRHERFVIPVSEVHGVVDVPLPDTRKAPDTLTRFSGALVKAVAGISGRSVGIIDGDSFFQALNRSLRP